MSWSVVSLCISVLDNASCVMNSCLPYCRLWFVSCCERRFRLWHMFKWVNFLIFLTWQLWFSTVCLFVKVKNPICKHLNYLLYSFDKVKLTCCMLHSLFKIVRYNHCCCYGCNLKCRIESCEENTIFGYRNSKIR